MGNRQKIFSFAFIWSCVVLAFRGGRPWYFFFTWVAGLGGVRVNNNPPPPPPLGALSGTYFSCLLAHVFGPCMFLHRIMQDGSTCLHMTKVWWWNTKVKVVSKVIDLYFRGSPRYGSFWIIVFQMPKMKVDHIWTMNLPREEIVKKFEVGFESIKQRSHLYGEYGGTKQDISPSNHHNKNKFFFYKIVVKMTLESLLLE